ncbi:MAG: hypothetical protein VB093_02785, partial [Propionicimonas sp.]|nr:hypothetical protein [Propionicimonas sp.]
GSGWSGGTRPGRMDPPGAVVEGRRLAWGTDGRHLVRWWRGAAWCGGRMSVTRFGVGGRRLVR